MRHKKGGSFSLRKRIKSFEYAINGIVLLCRNEQNAQIHLLVLSLVVIFGLFFEISASEWISITIVSGMVLLSEGFNTTIEYLADHVTPDFHEVIGRVKDVAAGSVLIAAISAAITGAIIFIPKILGWISFLRFTV